MPAPVLDRSTFVRPMAHRGLHDAEQGRMENSAPAFEAAIAAGFGIECDVRASSDGSPLVFHDANCDRLLGRSIEVANLKAADLAALTYPDGSPVLTLAAFLALVDGRAPVLMELKGDFKAADPQFTGEVALLTSSYRGPLAVMSFEPELMLAMSRLAPAVPRGLVAAEFETETQEMDVLGAVRASSLARLEAFEEVGASFAAYDVNGLPNPAIARLRRSGVPVFVWTVRTERQLRIANEHGDAPIFEGPITRQVQSHR